MAYALRGTTTCRRPTSTLPITGPKARKLIVDKGYQTPLCQDLDSFRAQSMLLSNTFLKVSFGIFLTSFKNFHSRLFQDSSWGALRRKV
jgi:hypothetical protein